MGVIRGKLVLCAHTHIHTNTSTHTHTHGSCRAQGEQEERAGACGGLERKQSIKGLSNVLPFVLSTPNKQWTKKRHTLLSAVDATTERDPDL